MEELGNSARFTVNDERSCAAPPSRHHVPSHARVVRRVREPGLLDDQIVINGDQEIGVLRRINDVLILQPVHLEGGKRRNTHTAEIKTRELITKTTKQI